MHSIVQHPRDSVYKLVGSPSTVVLTANFLATISYIGFTIYDSMVPPFTITKHSLRPPNYVNKKNYEFHLKKSQDIHKILNAKSCVPHLDFVICSCDFDCYETSTYAEILKGSILGALTSCGLDSAAYSPCNAVTTLSSSETELKLKWLARMYSSSPLQPNC